MSARKITKHYIRKNATATFSTEGNYISFTGSYSGGSGACGDSICEEYPEFEPLNIMHLANAETGAPMHAWANARYFAENDELDKLQSHLRCTEFQAKLYADKAKHATGNPGDTESIDSLVALEEVIEEQWREQLEEMWDAGPP